jgi:ABC-type glycerol-3-phosphate transport system substrate-binding protein
MYFRTTLSSVQRKISVLILGAVLLLVGCQGVLPSPEPPVHQGEKVRVACPPELAELVRTQSRVWQARQQAEVEVVEYDRATGPSAVKTADVWVVRPADLPHWASAKRLLPLPESFTAERDQRFDWSSLLPAYSRRLLVWGDREAFAVPLQGEAPVCVYRADLYARADLQKAYRAFQERTRTGAVVRELRAPATWQEFATQAEFFRAQPPLPGGPSLPPLPEDEAALDRLFYTVAAPCARRGVPRDQPGSKDHHAEVFAFHYDLKTGKPRIATGGFVTALQLLQRLQKCRPAGTSPRPATALLESKAVLGIVEASWLVEFQKKPDLRDRFGVCQVPGSDRYFTPQGSPVILKETSNRVPYLGGAGWLACVPGTSTRPEAAFDLLADMAGPTRSAQAALEPRWGGPIRTDQLLRESWSAYDLDRARTQALREALNRTLLNHGIKNPVLCLRTPDQGAHRRTLVAGLRKALQENQQAGDVLAGVARNWEALDAKKGKDALLTDYRISLGLLGE